MGADWGSNLGPGTPKIINLPNVLVVLRTFSRICKHPQKPNENTRLSGAPEPKFDPKSIQNLPPGVSGVALSFFNGQHTVSQRQPTKTKKKPQTITTPNGHQRQHKRLQLAPTPSTTNPTTSRTMQGQSTPTFTSGKTTGPTRPQNAWKRLTYHTPSPTPAQARLHPTQPPDL